MSSQSRPQEVRPTVLMIGDAEPMALRLRTAMSWHGLALAEAVGPAAIQAIHVGTPDLVFLVGDAVKDGGDKILEALGLDPVASRVRVAILSDDIGLLSRDRSGARVVGVVPRSGSSDAIGRRVAELAREAKTTREHEASPSPKVDTKLTEIDALRSVRNEMETSNTGEFMITAPIVSKRVAQEPEAASPQNLSWQDSAPTRMAPEFAAQNVNEPSPETVTKEISIEDDAFEELSSPRLPERDVTLSLESAPGVLSAQAAALSAGHVPPPPPPPATGRPDSKKHTLIGLSAAPPPAFAPSVPAPPQNTSRDSTLLGLQDTQGAEPSRREASRSVSLPLTAKQSLAKQTTLGLSDSPPQNPGVPAPPPWPPPEPRHSDRPELAESQAMNALGATPASVSSASSAATAPPEELRSGTPRPLSTANAAATPPFAPPHAPAAPAAAQKKAFPLMSILGVLFIVAVLIGGALYFFGMKSAQQATPQLADTRPTIEPLPQPGQQQPAPIPVQLVPPPVVALPAAPVVPPQAVVALERVEEVAPSEAPEVAAPVEPAVAAEPQVDEPFIAPPADGASGDTLAARGDAALGSRDYAAAATAFRQALSVDPGNPHAYEGLARLNLRTGARQEALNYAQRAVQVRPRRAQYRILLGDVYQALGDRPRARRAWEEALRLEPRNRDATRRLH